jgi:hypothetical protein
MSKFNDLISQLWPYFLEDSITFPNTEEGNLRPVLKLCFISRGNTVEERSVDKNILSKYFWEFFNCNKEYTFEVEQTDTNMLYIEIWSDSKKDLEDLLKIGVLLIDFFRKKRAADRNSSSATLIEPKKIQELRNELGWNRSSFDDEDDDEDVEYAEYADGHEFYNGRIEEIDEEPNDDPSENINGSFWGNDNKSIYDNDEVRTFRFITSHMIDLYAKKNHDYGNSFDESLDDDGLIVSKIRLGDKLKRFSSLIGNDKQEINDESIEDTLIDLANYSVMTLSWMRRNGYGGLSRTPR